jgi:hypothetical protein
LKTTLIITSIAAPNSAMKSFAAEAGNHGIKFMVIGDRSSPEKFDLDNCQFVSIDEQKKLNFRLAKNLPEKHYSRKNLGYLIAANDDIIIETDDDNFPKKEFWNSRSKNLNSELIEGEGWLNVYKYFSYSFIWPRGFPLEFLKKEIPLKKITKEINAPIQQGLADENPDVDAVYRMCHELPAIFQKKNSITLGKNTWCPFNSQNTTWFKDAFPLLYLPSYCSFRMTDIWRSFIAQRIAWTCEWNILFHNATVWQERNEHNLLRDFEDEIPGYLHNSKICSLLGNLDLKSGVENMSENLLRCYSMMVEEKFIQNEELKLLEDWLFDIHNTR